MNKQDNNAGMPQAGKHNVKRVFDSAAVLQPGGAKQFDRLYRQGFRLKAVVSLKKTGDETPFDPIAVAILRHSDKKRSGAFLSVIHERSGDWLYSDAVPYAGGLQ